MGWLISYNLSIWDDLALTWFSVVDSGVDWLESLEEQDCAGSVHICCRTMHQQQQSVWDGLAAITSHSAVEYPLRLKLIGIHIEDVSFATDQTERHLEVGNTIYRNYDSSAKIRLLVSLGIFLRIYYKGGKLGEQSASLSRASVLTEEQPVG
ncbi:hypothetical protein Adt_31752 [Abeliophyllum distichum]|uniref:Uncharacterized protein n=1 Tax=Abeliophyllum distichum TaxID=126358 RepID=A0ABD1REZ0_9LAMI